MCNIFKRQKEIQLKSKIDLGKAELKSIIDLGKADGSYILYQ